MNRTNFYYILIAVLSPSFYSINFSQSELQSRSIIKGLLSNTSLIFFLSVKNNPAVHLWTSQTIYFSVMIL